MPVPWRKSEARSDSASSKRHKKCLLNWLLCMLTQIFRQATSQKLMCQITTNWSTRQQRIQALQSTPMSPQSACASSFVTIASRRLWKKRRPSHNRMNKCRPRSSSNARKFKLWERKWTCRTACWRKRPLSSKSQSSFSLYLTSRFMKCAHYWKQERHKRKSILILSSSTSQSWRTSFVVKNACGSMNRASS